MNSLHRALLILAVLLSVALAADGAIVTHRYSFTADATDSVGNADATLIGGATVAGGELILPGGTPRTNYASLPLSVGTEINGYGGLTVELWFTQNFMQNWSKAFYFGNNAGGFANDGLEFAPLKGDGSGASKVEFLNDSVAVAFGANGAGDPSPFYVSATQYYVAAVFDAANDLLSFYSDGLLAGTKPLTNGELADLTLSGLFIGAAVGWNDPDFNGSINEFRIWDGALDTPQIEAQQLAGPEVVVPEPSTALLLAFALTLSARRLRRS